MSDLEIPCEAVQVVADHCFGEDKGDGVCGLTEDDARVLAAAALDDAAPLIVDAMLAELLILADDIEAGRVTAEFVPHSTTLYVCAEAIRGYVHLHQEATGG